MSPKRVSVSTSHGSGSKGRFRYEIQYCSHANDGLEISWFGVEKMAYFSFAWLRDWCCCDVCTDRHEVDSAAMLEIDLTELPNGIWINDNGELELTWKSDGHKSIYSPDWLKSHSGSLVHRKLGHSGDELGSKVPSVTYESLRKDEKNQLYLLECVRDYGFGLVRNLPDDPDEVGKVGTCLGYIQGGWRYSAQPEEILVAAARPSETAGAVSQAEAMQEEQDAFFRRTLLVPHTDFSFTSWPTGLFIFHCLRPSPDCGGQTILVDGFHVAERLRNEDPQAFRLLSTIRYPFRGHGETKRDWCSHARVISTDDHETVTGIRFAMGSRTPISADHCHSGPYTEAIQSMLRLVLEPSSQLLLPLGAGDCLVMDNHRMLHGRTGMDPKAGDKRWFRRFDVERDAAQTRMRVLARKMKKSVAPLPSGAHG